MGRRGLKKRIKTEIPLLDPYYGSVQLVRVPKT